MKLFKFFRKTKNINIVDNPEEYYALNQKLINMHFGAPKELTDADAEWSDAAKKLLSQIQERQQ